MYRKYLQCYGCVALLLAMLCLCACTNGLTGSGIFDEVTVTVTISPVSQAPANTDTNTLTTSPVTDEPTVNETVTAVPTISFEDMSEIILYTINPNTMQKEISYAMVTGETVITPQYIIDAVLDSMDGYFLIGIESVHEENSVIYVSFQADKTPVVNVDATTETELLDVFAQSLLDNLPACSGVCFRVEQQAYRSQNYQFTIDEIYMGR